MGIGHNNNWCQKRASSVHYGYRKWGTHAVTCISVFPNTCAWEHKDWNKTMKQRKKVRRGEWMWKEVQRTRKKQSPVHSLCLVQSRQTRRLSRRSLTTDPLELLTFLNFEEYYWLLNKTMLGSLSWIIHLGYFLVSLLLSYTCTFEIWLDHSSFNLPFARAGLCISL